VSFPSDYVCQSVWGRHSEVSVPFNELGLSSFGWTNGNFDLYGCGSCGCPVCYSGSPVCDRSENAMETPLDDCACVCPLQESFNSSYALSASSLATPIVLFFYASYTSSGEPLGPLLGNATVFIRDSYAEVHFTASSGYTLTNSSLYIGNGRFPESSTLEPNPGKFPYQGTGSDVTTEDFIVNIDSYDFYIAAYGIICGYFPSSEPSSSPSSRPSPSPSLAPSFSLAPSKIEPTSQPRICESQQTIVWMDFENYDWSCKFVP